MLAALHFASAAGAAAFWALGMYFWWILDYGSEPSRKEPKRRMVNSFIAMVVFGFAAFGLRHFNVFIT